MLNLSRDWRWWVDGADVSSAVESWELGREQPDLDTPAYWRGKVVLVRPAGSTLVLDPLANPQWRQGAEVRLEIDGRTLLTGRVLLAYYNDWAAVPQLELEVGDMLAYLNRRRVIPLAQHSPQSLLGLHGAPSRPEVEITTDLESPVRLAQQLTWVADPPSTLYTLPDGTVGVAQPELSPSLSRQVTEVLDAARVRPALEIPGSVVASATFRGPAFRTGQDEQQGAGQDGQQERILIAATETSTTITILDGLGRPIREETHKGRGEPYSLSLWRYTTNERGGYTITRVTYLVDGSHFEFWETEEEELELTSSSLDLPAWLPWGGYEYRGEAKRVKRVIWPLSRLGFRSSYRSTVYLETELYFTVKEREHAFRPVATKEQGHVFRSVARARGTIEEGLPLEEARKLVTVSSEVKPGEYNPPAWARPSQGGGEEIVVPISATAEVAGGEGPPLYVSLPWLTDPEAASRALERHARWVATEVAGRVYARRLVMPVPDEWLADPRPWRMLRFDLTPPEALWLVGERLVADKTGVRFEALGVLASPPGRIPEGGQIPGGGQGSGGGQGPGGGQQRPAPPSLLSFVQRARPTVGIAVFGGTVERVVLEGTVGYGVEASVLVEEY